MEHAALAYLRSVADGHPGHKHRPFPDPGVPAHVAMRIDGDFRADDGRGIDGGQGADGGVVRRRRIEQPVDPGERAVGLVDPQEIQGGAACRLVGHDHRAGLAGSEEPPVPRMADKGDVSRTRLLDGRNPLDGHVRVTDHPSAHQLGEVRERFAWARHLFLSTGSFW